MGSAKSTSFCISLKVFTNINEKCLNAEKNQQIFFSPETVGAGADFFWESGGGGLDCVTFAPLFRDSTQPDIISVIFSEIHFHQTLALIYSFIEEEHAKVKFFPKEPKNGILAFFQIYLSESWSPPPKKMFLPFSWLPFFQIFCLHLEFYRSVF